MYTKVHAKVVENPIKSAILGLLSVAVFSYLILSNQAAQTEASLTPFQTTLAQGLALPTAMEFAPDGRLFISQKSGKLRVFKDGALLATPALTIPVTSTSERGLLGIAFSPTFAQDQYIYLYYTRAGTVVKNRVSRFTFDPSNPDVLMPGSEFVIVDDIASDAGNHNGGAIHFGPDGKLYISIGDGGRYHTTSQELNTLSGKILRVNADGTIPEDNPFVGTPGARPEIWAMGLRNPFTFAFEPGTGKMYINDVGQQTWEEVNLGAPGANYGWPTCEGFCTSTSTPFQNPVFVYGHDLKSGGAAITGGAFVTGTNFPSEKSGSYFYGDYVLGGIREYSAGGVQSMFFPSAHGPSDVKFGPDGMLYWISVLDGTLNRIAYPSGTVNNAPVAVANGTPLSGVTPLTVAFSAASSTDAENDPLTYSWDFGDGSALGTGVTSSHTYSVPGVYIATLTANDGTNASVPATVSVSAGKLPSAKILKPVSGARYRAFDKITYTGQATDTVTNLPLPDSAYSWTIVFHHDTHTHPFLGPITGTTTGTFAIPATGEQSPNTWYSIHLTATNSSGLTKEVIREIKPRTVLIYLKTVPAGLALTLDGQPSSTPSSFYSVQKFKHTLLAPSTQTINGKTYKFKSWSDGTARSHTFQAPTSNATYTATYVLVP